VHDATPFDLRAYLIRIGCEARPQGATPTVLADLHERHVGAIPFENLDVRLGRPIRLDLAALQAKLVTARRGGYCFEQNTLFAAALRALGFEVATLEARVRPPGATSLLPRTHMVLRVVCGGREWLTDVGFGGDGPLRPVPFDGEVAEQPGGPYRLVAEGPLRALQVRRQGAWGDLYAFGPEPALPVDFEVASHFTSTHPGSPFVRTLTVQHSTAEARSILRGRTWTERRGDEVETHEITTDEACVLIRDRIGLDVPEVDLLRALGEG
jgi:N-hydroxyarylamine O-acetyltransferase